MEQQDAHKGRRLKLPVLPLRDVVVYPHMVVPLFIGREKSVRALDAAMASDRMIYLVTQRNAQDDEPDEKQLYSLGTIATVIQFLKLPDGTIKVLVEGDRRASLGQLFLKDSYCLCEVYLLPDEDIDSQKGQVLSQSLLSQFETYVQLGRKVPAEVFSSLSHIRDPAHLADGVASHLGLAVEERQKILEMTDLAERMEYLIHLVESEIDLLQVDRRVRGRVKQQMERSQREHYLNEQMKAIQKELTHLDDSKNEFHLLKEAVERARMPEEALARATSELKKLRQMSPLSAEATVVRNYIDWMISVPWYKRSRIRYDLKKAADILEQDHFGLEEIKERVLEYLAVQKRVRKPTGAVLCLVGPPGVGKTSLGKSVARAANRHFCRMALGGVRDEAEIRGHRRTYIGSMPGRLIQKIIRTGVRNPLVLLDEIDKMGFDMRGDPAAALLEVLDPEQNNSFSDHYLEVDYNLSEVMFVCTSNSMDIPPPLLDRMEIIRIPGYTEDEKLGIARRYLIPKQKKGSGLKTDELDITDATVRDLVRYYTREAGVRGLEREIGKICRKVVKEKTVAGVTTAEGSCCHQVTPDDIERYCKGRKFKHGCAEKEGQIGRVTGLAWTSVGGELLHIETAVIPGKGKVIKTGSLGDVMQESVQAAVTVVRSRADALGIAADFYKHNDLHVHVPEGATPKDGPSAGVAMCTSLVSALARIPARSTVAMTGEITLHGRVLPIGGLKEKLLAAHRGGITTVLIPEENRRDLNDIPENIKSDLDVRPVEWIDQVLEVALQPESGQSNAVTPHEDTRSPVEEVRAT